MENSMGLVMNMVVTSTTMASEMEMVSMTSMTMVGMGMSITKRMVTTPLASSRSPCLANFS